MKAKPFPGSWSPRILVVEDDPGVSELVSSILEDRGATVITAADSETAMRRVKEGSFDVLILDLILPDTDGVILHGKVKNASPELGARTIFMTGFTSREPVIDYLRSRGAEFVHKPFRPDEMLEAVDRLLAER